MKYQSTDKWIEEHHPVGPPDKADGSKTGGIEGSGGY